MLTLTNAATGATSGDGSNIYVASGTDDLELQNNEPGGKIHFRTKTGAGALTLNMEIMSDGDVEVSAGNLVIGAAGKGIDFQNSSDNEIGAGSVSAEILDDYEEGTFTATSSWATQGDGAGTITGGYTKIGNKVSIVFNIGLNKGTASGVYSVTGLPFTNGSSAAPCSIRTSGIGASSMVLQAMVLASSTSIRPLLAPQNNSAHGADLTAAGMKADSYFYATATYLT